MSTTPKLYCPIRGELRVTARAKDGLTFSEEKRRIECIVFLLGRNYPKNNFRVEKTLVTLGHKGKNSLRADIVVYDRPVDQIVALPLDEQNEHVMLVAEIKRDNKDSEDAKRNQLEPALRLIPNIRVVGVYWDDIEQRLFYKEIRGNSEKFLEAPIAFIPEFGFPVQKAFLKYADLAPSSDLIGLFRKIEDSLHHYVADKAARFQILMQLLLVKMHDEKSHKKSSEALGIQDFTIVDTTEEQVISRFNEMLKSSLSLYQRYLPAKVQAQFDIPAQALREISQQLAPINLLNGDPNVVQDFYMYFAKQIYKWDLAQYFTPYEVVDFIVRIINPIYGENIKDPACGSADFLTCAYRYLSSVDDKAGDRVWGADVSRQAVQISILNMLLNDDGKSNIKEEDSLVEVMKSENQFDVMLCNPPFGVRNVEKREEVLSRFDLGKGRDQQETGILFTELCVKQAKFNNGRIAIIVPNGYLGNRSDKYTEFRRWVLKHTYVVGIIAFPRFTFKKAGADVSASVLILEKREQPLRNLMDIDEYPVFVNTLDSVGWNIGDQKARKIYRYEPETGAIVLDQNNQPVLDADFDEVLADLFNSAAANRFSWLLRGQNTYPTGTGWSVNIKRIIDDPYQLLDPKRLSRKYITLVESICQVEHKKLGDICSIVPQGIKLSKSQKYRYVEIAGIHERSYEYSELYGWQLPSRAKHAAEPGDIFIGGIWSSVGKWMIAGEETAIHPTVVTNGCYRLKMLLGQEKYLPDLVFALSSEFYRVQMRALATGSDGLAEVSENDLKNIVIPVIPDDANRKLFGEVVAKSLEASTSLTSLAGKLLDSELGGLSVLPRKSNFAQV
ncbi:MAG: N-6 DNA methylase [Chloroflexi bacterium]|nr:N-6 DNA methylase [Chloroflexota bacterium]